MKCLPLFRSGQIVEKCCLTCQDKLRRTKQKISYIKKPSTTLGLLNALGAPARSFESCRPDNIKLIHTRELPRLDFLLEIMSITSVDKRPTK